MKIAVLSGARKNAGDYLITERCEKLLYSNLKGTSIQEYPINEKLDNYLDEINSNDVIIVPGGPMGRNEYPASIPLVEDLTKIKKKMIGIGIGWYGKYKDPSEVYNYVFSESTVHYLNKIVFNQSISCRDWYTVRAMRNNGVKDPTMTGCPAWYDIDYIETDHYRKNINFPFKKIAISDPARRSNISYIIPLINYIRSKFPNAEINYIFHRGISSDQLTGKRAGMLNSELANKLKNIGVKIHDISYSSNGLAIYDNCDLHIGFRVHAHIYCLSHRGLSILFEEDGRGAGVNSALGLEGIEAYKYTAPQNLVQSFRDKSKSDGSFLIKRLDDYLYQLEKLYYKPFNDAYIMMQHYYEEMQNYISRIENIL